jgi:hypothetical protein
MLSSDIVSKNIFEALDRKPQERHQLFFVIGPQHSGADELYERLKKEFQDLTTVNATTSPDGIINTLFPPTNEKVPAGPALLECFPVTIRQWNILKEGSKNGDDPQLWQPKKSLVIKVTSAKGLVREKAEKASMNGSEAEGKDKNEVKLDANARADIWKTHKDEEKVVDTVVNKFTGTSVAKVEHKGE